MWRRVGNWCAGYGVSAVVVLLESVCDSMLHIMYACGVCPGRRKRMHNGTRDRVQTCLTVVGGIPTNLSHERTPGGASTEQAQSDPRG